MVFFSSSLSGLIHPGSFKKYHCLGLILEILILLALIGLGIGMLFLTPELILMCNQEGVFLLRRIQSYIDITWGTYRLQSRACTVQFVPLP